jgi:hypothetical protein
MLSSCEKPDDSENIRLTIESIKLIKDTVRLQTKIYAPLEGISDHGYCWAVFPGFPHLQNAPYTCYGPLENSAEFTGDLTLGEGYFIVRAYIVQRGFVYYSNSKTVGINE